MKYFNLTITALVALLPLVHTLSSDLETGTQPGQRPSHHFNPTLTTPQTSPSAS